MSQRKTTDPDRDSVHPMEPLLTVSDVTSLLRVSRRSASPTRRWMMLEFVKGLFRQEAPLVRFDEAKVFLKGPRGQEEKLLWKNLRAVHIVTTDDGPWNDDLFWVLCPKKRIWWCHQRLPAWKVS